MRGKLAKMLYRQMDEGIRKLFPEAEMRVGDPPLKLEQTRGLSVEELRRLTAGMELLPPECRFWRLNRQGPIWLFLVLIVSPKEDCFTIEVMGSRHGRLPNSSRLDDPEGAWQKEEFGFRFGRLMGLDGTYGKDDPWWYLGRRRALEDILAGIPEDPLEVKLAAVEPKVQDALAKLRKYAVPYLKRMAERYGVQLVMREPPPVS